ncbi:ankyrin repeat-containing domain protein [Dactylonectria estremocensis]|uniref:Ankyrin repeat-containing domain protein n=1 Tax=Dactylonectria estremocensis TaxID=1079267 RepID=A0A9P9J347_9HYPO|nr:ankyrin repeat-containing domain protein [Dactylonectria estremocensis]
MAASGVSHVAVRLLLGKGADPSKLDADYRKALPCAIESEHMRVVQLLTRKTSGLADVVDHEKRTVLHDAASQGHHAITEMLLKSGADIDAQDGCGQTPLQIAVSQSHEDVAIYLIRRGADLNVPYKKKRKVVHLNELVASIGNLLIMEEIHQARVEIRPKTH